MIVADTDVLIDFLADHRPGALAVAAGIQADQLATTTVNCFELLAGAQNVRNRMRVVELLESIRVLLLDFLAARRAAEVRRQLERLGVGIGMGDSLIAGITLTSGSSLLTRNRRHFARQRRELSTRGRLG